MPIPFDLLLLLLRIYPSARIFTEALIIRAKYWEPKSISRRLVKSMLAEFYDRIKCCYKATPYALMDDLPVAKASGETGVHSMLSCV